MVGPNPINPGTVDWSGENPGMYLKETQDGPWKTLAVFFRIVLSPRGRGHAMVVLEEPDTGKGMPDVHNICLTDNEPMMRYLIDGWLRKFPSFLDKPGLAAMTFLPLTSVEAGGDSRSRYTETARGGGLEVQMVWEQLGKPFAAEVPVEQSATKEHEMYSLFVEAKEASVSINGRRLAGQVGTRQFFGRTMSTAFLAFSETWVTPLK